MYLAIVVAIHHCKARISLSMHACFKVGSEKVAKQAKVCLGVAICMHLMHYFKHNYDDMVTSHGCDGLIM